MISFWLLRLFNLESNFAIRGLFNVFFLIATTADWESENTVFRVPALGDQVKCQDYCVDL